LIPHSRPYRLPSPISITAKIRISNYNQDIQPTYLQLIIMPNSSALPIITKPNSIMYNSPKVLTVYHPNLYCQRKLYNVLMSMIFCTSFTVHTSFLMV